jgi:OOP family OmpA-OmpF porin
MKTKARQIQILGLLSLALLFIITIPLFAKRIPTTLQTHLTQQLSQQGYDWVNVTVKGRNVTLSGNAPSTDTSFAALNIIEKYTPLLHIKDQITPRIIRPYSMKMEWDGKSLKLKGYLADKDSYNKLLETSYQIVDKAHLENNVELGAGTPKNWFSLVNTSLQGLLSLQQGYIEITNLSFYFAGQTPHSTQREKIIQSIKQYNQYKQKLHIVAADSNSKICQDKFKQLLKNSQIKFTSGKAILDKSSYPLLTKLANIATLCSHSTITIEGHTDNQGNTIANMKLSQQRAQSVANWLFQQGITEQQLTAIGYGAKRPIADNSNETGRAMNRRIEFIVKGER